MSSDENRPVAYDKIGNMAVQMPFHFTREKLEDVLSPHFDLKETRDSFFYNKVVSPPARARFSILRNAGLAAQSLSGFGRSWNWNTCPVVPSPVSMWKGARPLKDAQILRPFHPASGSSMRPSIHFV